MADDHLAWRDVLSVPLIALSLAAWVFATGTDRAVFLAVNGWSEVTGSAPWPYITILGDTAVAIALLTPVMARRPDLAWALAIGGIAATLFVHGFKPFLNVARPPAVFDPSQFHLIGPGYRANSFPSGHTTTIFFAAALLCLHFRSATLRIAVVALAILVGLSRIVVGVHWPLDVLVGAAGGWACAAFGVWGSGRWLGGRSATAHWIITLIGAGCGIALVAGLKTGYPEAFPLQLAAGSAAIGATLLRTMRRFGTTTRTENRHD
ncbi:MAG: phosphatase PAP2 family protein [Betaproteobacteria bacterium]|nr:phosphatase PAP2 family protein [Betaproteobacteria bacterium]